MTYLSAALIFPRQSGTDIYIARGPRFQWGEGTNRIAKYPARFSSCPQHSGGRSGSWFSAFLAVALWPRTLVIQMRRKPHAHLATAQLGFACHTWLFAALTNVLTSIHTTRAILIMRKLGSIWREENCSWGQRVRGIVLWRGNCWGGCAHFTWADVNFSVFFCLENLNFRVILKPNSGSCTVTLWHFNTSFGVDTLCLFDCHFLLFYNQKHVIRKNVQIL